MFRKREINFDKIYYNYGQNKAFKIIQEVDPIISNNGSELRRILIKFLESGYETIILLYKIQEDKPVHIIDYLSPTVRGVGIIGYKMPKENPILYSKWYSMITRCYSGKEKYDSYKSVYVCDRWLRFDYFLEDAVTLPGYNDMINNPDIQYDLDKDILQQGYDIKVYSPTTCMFVPSINNNIQKIIDNKSKCINNKYYGVQLTRYGTYDASINIDGKHISFGTYDNEIAAANAHNYFSKCLGKQVLNNVPYMNHKEFSSHLTKLINMVVDENRFFGVRKLPSGNYYSMISYNHDDIHLGTFTDKIAAANVYNYFAQINGSSNRNNVEYMSPEECRNYMVNPRVMCIIVDNKEKKIV